MEQKSTYKDLEKRVSELEREIDDSKAFFQNILNNISDPVFVKDEEHRWILLNDSYCRASGYSREQLIGKSDYDFYPKEQADIFWNKDDQVIQSGKVIVNEEMYTDSKGNEHVIKTTKTRFMDNDGKKFIVGLAHDITEHKKAEESLKDSEKNLRRFVDNFPGAAYISDPGKCIIYANKMLADLYNLSVEEIIGLDFKEYVYPEFYSKIVEQDRVVVEENHTLQLEETLQLKSNLSEWLTYKFPIVKRSKASLVGGFSINITERKQAEDALRESELLFRSTFEQMAVGICHADPTGQFIRLNNRFCDVIKYSKDEMLNLRWQDITYPEDLEKDLGYTQQLKKNKIQTYSFEKRFIRKDNSIVWVNLTVSLVRKLDGNPKYFIYVIEDINHRKKMEKKLRQTQKMEAVGTLAGGIAHDFNNMLGVITGNVSYALSHFNQDGELIEVLSDVQEGVKQAQTLTQQLLTFAKGGAPIRKSADINKIIRESAKFIIRGAKAKCNFEFSGDLWNTEVDEGQINQAISNFVINANQAMPDGGIIQIRTENINIDSESNIPLKTGQYVKIIVKDQGIGISDKHISKIFDPYFSTKQNGSGLGLATTFSIIKRHGGHISVESKMETGTTFHIYLPASDKITEQIEEKEESKHNGHGKILIMDDQEPILKMLGRMLNHMGYETAFAKDGSQAIEMYKEAQSVENPFDMVILDLTVPGGMGGAKTIPELLKIDPNIKAVVSSGYSNDPIMANYQSYGFADVVPKPYTKDQLVNLLNKIFDKKG